MGYYFGYGSNLNKKDIGRYLNQFGNKPVFRKIDNAFLVDFALVFNSHSSVRRGGVASFIYERGSFVPGVLYKVCSEAEYILDIKEGAWDSPVNKGYVKVGVKVKLANSLDVRKCFTYQYQNDFDEMAEYGYVKPSKEYYGIINDGYVQNGMEKYLPILEEAYWCGERIAV